MYNYEASVKLTNASMKLVFKAKNYREACEIAIKWFVDFQIEEDYICIDNKTNGDFISICLEDKIKIYNWPLNKEQFIFEETKIENLEVVFIPF